MAAKQKKPARESAFDETGTHDVTLGVSIDAVKRILYIDLGEIPITRIGMPKSMALDLATALIKKSHELE
jgi:hypothetical protein